VHLGLQDEGALAPLAALRQLTLHYVTGDGPGLATLAQDLSGLQQLRVPATPYGLENDAMLQQLSPKVVDFNARTSNWVAAAYQLVQLTKLTLCSWFDWQEGHGDALSAPTGLQALHLCLSRAGSCAVDLVQHVAGMAQLRTLHLEGHLTDPQELSSCVAQCTQLTALLVMARGLQHRDPYWAHPWPAALRQLTGLHCLTVPAEVLEQQHGAWLAPLTALTRLGVLLQQSETDLPRECYQALGTMYADAQHQQQWLDRRYPAAWWLLQQVQEWPASLQQVLFTYRSEPLTPIRPRSWQHTPPGPGARQFTVWLEEGCLNDDPWAAEGWARPWRACRHLPGVWELQGREDGEQ
jgi:hypothetical protein